MIMQGSQTLGKTKKSKTAQRHSAGNIDYDNLPGSQESDEIPSQPQHTFRSRSKTVGDGKFVLIDVMVERRWKTSKTRHSFPSKLVV